MTEPSFSIITPTLNSEKHIANCIKSITNQAYLNKEHWFIDGLSNDNTINIIQQQSSQFSYIYYLNEKDKGIYDAMNKGIQKATGEWIFFLGSDDYLYNTDVLETIATHITTNPNAQIIYGNVWYEKYKCLYDGEFNIEKLLKHNICHQAIFYHRSVFQKIGLFDLQYAQEADYEFNLRCWFNDSITHTYIPVTISYYADGGASSIKRDLNLVRDYPSKITALALNNRNIFKRINLLSKSFRKILLRYHPNVFFNLLTCKKFFLSRMVSGIWMSITLPFYLLQNLSKK